MVIDKKYYYEKYGKIKSGVLQKETKAFYIFDNFVNTYVSEVVHIPNRFTR